MARVVAMSRWLHMSHFLSRSWLSPLSISPRFSPFLPQFSSLFRLTFPAGDSWLIRRPGPPRPAVSKNDRFCIKNDKLCIKNEKLGIKNEECFMKNDEIRRLLSLGGLSSALLA